MPFEKEGTRKGSCIKTKGATRFISENLYQKKSKKGKKETGADLTLKENSSTEKGLPCG